MKKLLSVIAIATSAYLLYSRTDVTQAPTDRPRVPQLASATTVPEAPPDTPAELAQMDCEITNAPSTFAPRQGIYHAAEAEIRTALDRNDYDILLQNSTPAKQLAAFTVAMKCSPAGGNADLSFISIETLLRITPGICASVGAANRSAPLKLLQPNQVLASPEIMLIAAKSALLQARYLEFIGGKQEQTKAHLVMAEQLGHDAAAAGLMPALSFMAEQYDTGGFGKVQLVKAYTYVKKVSDASPDSAAKSGAEYIYQKMTRSEFDKAEYQIKSCRRLSYQDSSLQSPFEQGPPIRAN